MKNYPQLFSKIKVGKVTFKNRVVMPAMATNFGQDGFVTQQLIDYYEARAKGGVGLIIVENASIDYPRGKDIANELRIDDMKYVAGFNNLVERLHSHGTKVFCQVHQCGNQTTLDHSEGVELISPSGVPCPQCKTQPRVLTIPEIKELVQSYVKGAHWAQVAGCDGVEIHGAHGYIIQQFMSPSTNFRHDEYGGTFERRMRFPLEIVKGVREVCGDDFIIDFRMSV
ncbi:MAG: NADH:flavin oxidoreductase, partial [Lachnospiraceae bacterium]|nr:NADH:flavin oxidoreductase [Lachnospiraceae bacterium]